MKNKKNILILAAHADDEVLGCGGVIQKYAENGDDVYVCVITDGVSSRITSSNCTDQIQARQKECLTANKILGTKEVIFLGFPDMKLDTIAHLELNKAIENVVTKIRPNIIYTHSQIDVNNDHKCVYNSTIVIARPGKDFLSKVYTYEVLTSTEYSRDEAFCPNTFVKINNFIEKKLTALSEYKSELRTYPNSRSIEGLKYLARYRGMQSNCEFAEAFKLVVSYNCE